MPLKTLGPIGPRAVGERVKEGTQNTGFFYHNIILLYFFSKSVHGYLAMRCVKQGERKRDMKLIQKIIKQFSFSGKDEGENQISLGQKGNQRMVDI